MSGKTMRARIAVCAASIIGACMTWSAAHAVAPLPERVTFASRDGKMTLTGYLISRARRAAACRPS